MRIVVDLPAGQFFEFGFWWHKGPHAYGPQLLVCLGTWAHFGYCRETGGVWFWPN